MTENRPNGASLLEETLGGARVAFGPSLSATSLVHLRHIGYQLLLDADDPMAALLGGLMIRVADLEDRLSDASA